MYKITSRTIDGVGAQRGWKAREAAARERMNAGISPELADNLRIAAERDQAERDAAAANIAESERLRRETACPCPACDGGQKDLSIDEAAFIMTALAYYRSHGFKIDPEMVKRMTYYAAHPTFVVRGTAVVDPKTYDNAPNIGAMNTASAPVAVHADADLAAVADAVREQIAPVSETAKPAKATRRHAPPPFLEDEA